MDGIQINQTEDGWTPLHIACLNGDLEVVKTLLSMDEIDVNRADKDGVTPLDIAKKYKHVYVVLALREHMF